MKKFIFLFVCFVSLISMSSCTAETAEQDKPQSGELVKDIDRKG